MLMGLWKWLEASRWGFEFESLHDYEIVYGIGIVEKWRKKWNGIGYDDDGGDDDLVEYETSIPQNSSTHHPIHEVV